MRRILQGCELVGLVGVPVSLGALFGVWIGVLVGSVILVVLGQVSA